MIDRDQPRPSNNCDAFSEVDKGILTSSPCRSSDLTVATNDTAGSNDSANTAEKNKILSVSFKLRTDRRKPRSRRNSISTFSQSLPPAIAPAISFDDLGRDAEAKDSPDTPLDIPVLISEEKSHAKAAPLSIFPTPLPLRKTRSSPSKKKLLSKSLTLLNSASLAKELEASLEQAGSFGSDVAIKNTENTSWFPIERSRDLIKKSVRFSRKKDEVYLIHYDWSCTRDYFYSSAEIATMKSARFEDAALLRNEEKTSATHDDLDITRRQKIVCIDSLLSLALNDPDENPNASIRGIEHMVYPELQQEMIRKKKEVQDQVMSFVRSKRPDPQGWRLANHSRIHSQWARDVALEKGQAYTMKIDHEEVQTSIENCKKVEPRRHRGRASRRRTDNDSVFSSMPTFGDGAAIAAAVRMEFFEGESVDAAIQGLQMNENRRDEDVAQGIDESARRDEWREEYDEA